MAIRHEDLWRALDTLAAENGMTPSGLARAAGLDATTFNRSKRRAPDGRPRWPSTESLSRALAATGATLETFTALLRGARTLGHGRRDRLLPVSRLEGAGSTALFDAKGAPAGPQWHREEAPPVASPADYALRIETDAHEPVLSRGDLAMVAPEAPIEDGDRVLACADELVFADRVLRQDDQAVTFGRRVTPRASLRWIHRIAWIGR